MKTQENEIPKNLLQFILILKKLHLKLHKNQNSNKTINLSILIKAFKYVEANNNIKNCLMRIINEIAVEMNTQKLDEEPQKKLIDNWPLRASNREIYELSNFQLKNPKAVKLDFSVRLFFKKAIEFLDEKNFKPDEVAPFNSHYYRKTIFDALQLTVKNKPARGDLIAINLSMQLSQQHGKPATLLLHGIEDFGLHDEINRIKETFHKKFDYEVLDVFCEQYSYEKEAFKLSGSPSVWMGSRPGLVTQFIHQHPKSVIFFHRLDKCHYNATQFLNEMFSHSTITDQHGLDQLENDGFRQKEKQPTIVDCSDTIFIFTTEFGSEIYEKQEMLDLLARDGASEFIYQTLSSATKLYDGDSIRAFCPTLLNNLAKNIISIPPQSYENGLAVAQHSIKKAIQKYCNYIEIKPKFKGTFIATLAQLWLLDPTLRKLNAHECANHYMSKLDSYIIQSQYQYSDVIFTVSKESNLLLSKLLEDIAEKNPPLELKKQSRRLVPKFALINNELTIENIEVQAITSLDNFTGDVKLEVSYPAITLNSVYGHEQAKQFFNKIQIYLKQSSILKKHNIEMPKGVLLYGPPGTGKTLLAKAFSGECKLPFIAVSGQDLLIPSYIKGLYKLANRYSPVIIFIDEADAIGNRKTSAAHAFAINKMLTEIQGFISSNNIFHILACNDPKNIDSAILRDGRIDTSFYIGTLNDEARTLMIQEIQTFIDHEIPFIKILDLTKGFTGAEMAKLRRDCGLKYIESSHLLNWMQLRNIILDLGEISINLFEESQQIAIHEIGHAIAIHLLMSEQLRFIVLNSKMAYVRSQRVASIFSLADVKKELICNLAGRAAEVVIFGKELGSSAGADEDFKMASQLALEAVSKLGMDETLGVFTPPQPELLLPSISNQFMSLYLQAAQMWVNNAMKDAMLMMQQHKSILIKLAELLQTQKVLEAEEFRREFSALIESRNRGDFDEKAAA